ncbi:glycosyltransferase family 4 protein [Listeria grandensis]|uniref:Glycosyltransferase family 4 protein n=1 Tax=Listeria grandensis TaxID=1494963 RepID=A0A7X0Y582_9LIST|nr:glycosyltransferase family 4 protein [Listeria grandensis]MBC1937008.1 glycosyltransferase family 4 protein [Listeria grandensis]
MNILMIGPSSASKGGIATVIGNFEEHFESDAHTVTYLATWQEGSFTQRLQTTIHSFFQLRKIIRDKHIDIVHIHMAQQGSFYRKALLLLLAKSKCRVILHIHASQFDIFYEKSHPLAQKYIRWILSKPDKVIVLSDEWATFYNTLTDVPVTVIENAVKMPAESTYNNASQHIIAFGRIGERKGSYDILKVANQVGQAFPDVQFDLYGDGELEKVAAEIEAQQLNNVRLGGWIDATAKEAILQDAALHILPSYHEGLPMAILETMACGIPNLSTRVGGIPQAITDNENGMLIEAGDTDQLATKIIRFLENQAMRDQFSEKARYTIATHFAIDPYLQKWEQIYTKTGEEK